MRIALIGATSHIAKGIIACFSSRQDVDLLLYARVPERISEFLAAAGVNNSAEVFPLTSLGSQSCDVIINCIGIGDPGKLKREPESIFTLTSDWDSLVLDALQQRPETLYVNFSSGAVYGTDFSQPVNETSPALFSPNSLHAEEFYGIAKLHSEARHRALAHLNIVDLRVFGYFSRYIDLDTRYLLTDIINCLKSGTELLTTADNIIRDYVHPEDLAALVECCIDRRRLNDVYDVYSLQPVTKFELLDYFAARHGLRYRVADECSVVTATGKKAHYYSCSRRAADLGYQPAYSSLECIRTESEKIMSRWTGY